MTKVANTIDAITQDEVLASVYKREKICSQMNDFFSDNLAVLDLAIDRVFCSPEKELDLIIERTSNLKGRTVARLYSMDKKYSIHCHINAIDYNLFLNKLDNIVRIAKSIKTNKEISHEVYKYLSPKQKILSFSLLKENWDTYGAKPINKSAVNLSIAFIEKIFKKGYDVYFVAPSQNGGVSVEMKKNDKRVRIDFERENKVSYLLFKENKINSIGKFSAKTEKNIFEWVN